MYTIRRGPTWRPAGLHGYVYAREGWQRPAGPCHAFHGTYGNQGSRGGAHPLEGGASGIAK